MWEATKINSPEYCQLCAWPCLRQEEDGHGHSKQSQESRGDLSPQLVSREQKTSDGQPSANVNSFASVQSCSGEGSSPGPGSGWLLHSWWGNEKSWSQRNENMCIGRLPLLNVPHDPGGQMAFYVVFTTVILDWLLNLFVFLTQLPASRLAFSLTRILRAEFEQLHYNFLLFLITVALVPASTTWSRPICLHRV